HRVTSSAQILPYTPLFQSPRTYISVSCSSLSPPSVPPLLSSPPASDEQPTRTSDTMAINVNMNTSVYIDRHGIACSCRLLIRCRSEEHTSELQSRFDIVFI